jgi:integrase
MSKQYLMASAFNDNASLFWSPLPDGEQKADYALLAIAQSVKRAGIRRRNPYHTRHTFACWLLSAGANPSFAATGSEGSNKCKKINKIQRKNNTT